MGQVGTDRLAQGIVSPDGGGGGGNTTSAIVSNIFVGVGETIVGHTLGVVPASYFAMGPTGKTLVVDIAPRTGFTTTQVIITSFQAIANVTLTLFAPPA